MLKILFEDSALIVCVKPAGSLSQSDERAPGSMPYLLEEHLGKGAYIGTVHRLDREAGGLMAFAKTREAAAALSRAFSGEAHKEYLAVAGGRFAEPEGEMRDLLFRDPRRNKSYVVKRERKGVREAALRYRVLEERETEKGELSLVAVTLLTGRTHQIRVQFASRKHPLLGDRKYGGKENERLMLWSAALAFPHPETGERLSFRLPPPQEGFWLIFEKNS